MIPALVTALSLLWLNPMPAAYQAPTRPLLNPGCMAPILLAPSALKARIKIHVAYLIHLGLTSTP